ncbi:hypothetical protein JW979_06070 [bacterium]|nr:hypothetical protein [candidate division CSSED10-310 bacterium]
MKHMKRWSVLLLFLAAGIPLYAATWHVPGDFPAIQAAIDYAVAGDTIVVSPGTYRENLNIFQKHLDILAEGSAEDTVIASVSQAGSVICLRDTQSKQMVFDGFTITQGTGTPYNGKICGGGIFVRGSSLLIRNCRINDNTAMGSYGTSYSVGVGGGLAGYSSQINIENSEFTGNFASGGNIPETVTGHGGEALGGGLGLFSCQTVLTDTDLTANTVYAGVTCRTDMYDPPMTGVDAYGGAFYVNGGTFASQGGEWSDNLCHGGDTDDNFGGECPGAIGGRSYGGVGWIGDTIHVSIENATIALNTSIAGYGISWY